MLRYFLMYTHASTVMENKRFVMERAMWLWNMILCLLSVIMTRLEMFFWKWFLSESIDLHKWGLWMFTTVLGDERGVWLLVLCHSLHSVISFPPAKCACCNNAEIPISSIQTSYENWQWQHTAGFQVHFLPSNAGKFALHYISSRSNVFVCRQKLDGCSASVLCDFQTEAPIIF